MGAFGKTIGIAADGWEIEMTLKDIQISVGQFVEKNKLASDPTTITLDILSELGEIAKEICKGTQYGKTSLTLSDNFEEEMGDVFFALINLANATNIDLNNAFQSTIRKMESRIQSKGHPGSHD